MSQKGPEYSFDGKCLRVVDASLGIDFFYDVIEPFEVVTIKQSEDSTIQPNGWVLLRSVSQDVENEGVEKIASEELFLNGLRHGPCRTYHVVSGRDCLATEGWYFQGQLHGRLRAWDIQGQLRKEMHFVHGKRSGEAKSWNHNGVLISSQVYKDGLPHGSLQTFHSMTGVQSRCTEYVKGRRHGMDYLFHGDDGFLLFCDEWKLGEKKRAILDDLLERNLHASIEHSKQQSGKKRIS